MLQKGHTSDGRQGHANVANWAKRRLGISQPKSENVLDSKEKVGSSPMK